MPHVRLGDFISTSAAGERIDIELAGLLVDEVREVNLPTAIADSIISIFSALCYPNMAQSSHADSRTGRLNFTTVRD